MADGITLDGADAIRRRLENAARRIPNEVARALYAEAEIEMTEAKRRTPVDTGALRSSGHVEPPSTGGIGSSDVSVTLAFGGPSAPYAIVVHEDLSALHKVGQAKYLESVIMESRPFMAARIAKRIGLERLV